MPVERIPRVMIAGTGSGAGKTTLTCALLSALLTRGKKPVSMKCGPDYIDPMFHRTVLGTKSGNLDLFLQGEEGVRSLLGRTALQADMAVLEGVMGYYDGIGVQDRASSYQVAAATDTPVLLVVDMKGMSLSASAIAAGFARFRPDSRIRGILLNRISPALYPALKTQMEAETGLPVMGYLPRLPDGALESRHLGLITPPEVAGLKEKLDALGKAFSQTADLDAIARVAQSAPPLSWKEPAVSRRIPAAVAVARDAAFCFYYEEALHLLTRLGARLIPFSPLEDEALPSGAGGLLLGGGYPELHAKKLSENIGMRESIRRALADGMPCVAECGGFLYLGQSLTTSEGNTYPMAGALPGEGAPAGKLRRFGYLTLRAKRDNLLCRAGEEIPAHEFHYFDSSRCGEDFSAQKAARREEWDCAFAGESLCAGFPHFHFGCNETMATRFLSACAAYEKKVRK